MKKTNYKLIQVKTGSVKDFFDNVGEVMRAADKGKPIPKRCTTLTFVDPTEMLHFLSAARSNKS